MSVRLSGGGRSTEELLNTKAKGTGIPFRARRWWEVWDKAGTTMFLRTRSRRDAEARAFLVNGVRRRCHESL